LSFVWPERARKRRELLFGSRLVPCYRERPSSLGDMFAQAVARAPRTEALVAGDMRLSYADLAAQVERFGAGLAALGIGRGDRVAILVENRPEFVITLLAAARVGAIAVPVGTREAAPGIAFVLENCRAVAIVHEASLAERLPAPAETAHLAHRIVVGGVAEGSTPFAAVSREAACPAVAASEEDTAVILYTSGTTGRPKGAMLAHVNIVHSAMHFEECWQLRTGDRSILAVPASHVTGLVAIIASMIRVAGCTILMRAFDVAGFLDLAARERLTTTVLVPAMYNLILLRGDLAAHDLSAWRLGGFGGAPMPEATIEAMAERLPDLDLLNAYGSTECATIISVVPPGRSRQCLDAVGAGVPCGDLRIVKDDGREAEPGEVGEVWIRGPMTVAGYWERDDATRASFIDGYWRSGDIGSVGADGFLRLFDRKNDVINRGGFKIYSTEVENVLARHPEVAEVAVVARPDPVLGEKVHAFIVPKGAAPSEDGVRQHCREVLAEYKVPDFVSFLSEALPRNANGKVLKRVLREGATQP
jgi:long-chain acyl-CoA synthetase